MVSLRFQPGALVGGCLIAVGTLCPCADGATLAELFNGGMLEAGDTRFTGWQLVDVDSTAAPAPDFNQIVVLPLVDNPASPGLQFTPNGQLSISGINAIDLHFRYRAQAIGGGNKLTAHTSSMNGITFVGSGGIALITNSMTTGSGADLGSTLSQADNETDTFEFTNTANVPPQSDIYVTINVFLTGLALTDSINLSSFTHRFAQNGPEVLAGDYNQNGLVDAADYVVWRDNVGAPAGTLPNDTTSGAIGAAQYNLWRANFGAASGAAVSSTASATVPEPATALLGMFLIVAVIVLRAPRAAS